MLYHRLECPHCGNEINVNSSKEPQKCHWCRRPILIHLKVRKGKKFEWIAEPVDFEDDKKPQNISHDKKKRKPNWSYNDRFGISERK